MVVPFSTCIFIKPSLFHPRISKQPFGFLKMDQIGSIREWIIYFFFRKGVATPASPSIDAYGCKGNLLIHPMSKVLFCFVVERVNLRCYCCLCFPWLKINTGRFRSEARDMKSRLGSVVGQLVKPVSGMLLNIL
jgi:hypothetical protein